MERVSATTLDQVEGCIGYGGTPKTLAQMKRATECEVRNRHDLGRYCVLAGGLQPAAAVRTARGVRQAASPTSIAATTEKVTGGPLKNRNAITSPASCTAKKLQAMSPALPGARCARSPNAQQSTAEKARNTLISSPKAK